MTNFRYIIINFNFIGFKYYCPIIIFSYNLFDQIYIIINWIYNINEKHCNVAHPGTFTIPLIIFVSFLVDFYGIFMQSENLSRLCSGVRAIRLTLDSGMNKTRWSVNPFFKKPYESSKFLGFSLCMNKVKRVWAVQVCMLFPEGELPYPPSGFLLLSNQERGRCM